MKYCSVLIGNSSSGIIELPSFKIPVVNIGQRQKNREKASNVVDVGYDQLEIEQAINKCLSQGFKDRLKQCFNPYGDGYSGKCIAKILSDIEITKNLLNK